MGKSSKPRKAYRPKYTANGLDAMAHVIRKVSPLQEADRKDLMLILHSAMHSLTHGTATFCDWGAVTNAMNLATVLAEHGVGKDFREDLLKAQHAHLRCKERKLSTGRFGYDAAGLNDVNYAIEVHDAQLQAATHGQMCAAAEEVHKELKSSNPSYDILKTPTENN